MGQSEATDLLRLKIILWRMERDFAETWWDWQRLFGFPAWRRY
jgi:hypothetical protein